MTDAVITDGATVERLAVLSEEAGEVVQILGKTLRHGWESHHPNTPQITNRMNVEEEIADFMILVGLLVQEGDIDQRRINNLIVSKKNKKNQYLHLNEIK